MKKELNFEINILPILDILSVLICFLLLTAVWVQIGSLETKQAIGDNSSAGSKNPPSMWIVVDEGGQLDITFRDLKGAGQNLAGKISADTEGVDTTTLSARLDLVHTQIPDLKTVVIRPTARSNYGNVVRVMDSLKQKQILDVGLSPLG